MRKAFIIAALFLLLLSMSSAALSEASSGSTAYPSVFSTSVSYGSVYTGQDFTIWTNSTYGFTNYSVILIVSSNNLTGISPTGSTYVENQSSPYQEFNFTAPSTSQTLFILMQSSALAGSKVVTYSRSFELQVVNPISMHADVNNPTSVTLYNVTVYFAINGDNITKYTIATLAPYSTYYVEVNTSATYLLNNGRNTLNVYVSTTAAYVSGTSSFYYGTPPNYTWIYYIAAVVVAFMIFLVYASGNRSVARRQPKWKR